MSVPAGVSRRAGPLVLGRSTCLSRTARPKGRAGVRRYRAYPTPCCSRFQQASAKQLCQFVGGNACLPKDGSEGSLRNFLVVRNRDAAIRGLCVPQHDVTPSLAIDDVADLLQRSNHVAAGNNREPDHELHLDDLFCDGRRNRVPMGFETLKVGGNRFPGIR